VRANYAAADFSTDKALIETIPPNTGGHPYLPSAKECSRAFIKS
jgi:hypothetical protein